MARLRNPAAHSYGRLGSPGNSFQCMYVWLCLCDFLLIRSASPTRFGTRRLSYIAVRKWVPLSLIGVKHIFFAETHPGIDSSSLAIDLSRNDPFF